jgi:hypothetical protein
MVWYVGINVSKEHTDSTFRIAGTHLPDQPECNMNLSIIFVSIYFATTSQLHWLRNVEKRCEYETLIWRDGHAAVAHLLS